MTAPARVLSPLIAILEDDAATRTMFQRILARDYELAFMDTAKALFAAIEKSAIKLVLLDILLPGENGMKIAKNLRALSGIPIILISGLSSSEVIAAGLNIGADDYITKPFDPLVLRARVHNALRRNPGQDQEVFERVFFEECVASPLLRTIVRRDGPEVLLTEKEFQLFMRLARKSCQVVSRDELSHLLTGADWSPLNRVLDVHISNLRKKLRSITQKSSIIVSYRSIGYMLQSQASFDV